MNLKFITLNETFPTDNKGGRGKRVLCVNPVHIICFFPIAESKFDREHFPEGNTVVAVAGYPPSCCNETVEEIRSMIEDAERSF